MKTLTLTLFAACLAAPAADIDAFFRDIYDRAVRVSTKVEFPHLVSQQPAACAPFCPIPAPDPVTGRLNFGFNAAQTQIDDTFALFQGSSRMLNAGVIISNGRTCTTCHRPDRRDSTGALIEELQLGLPHASPLTDTIPLTDKLFTGRQADDGNHPQAFDNLNLRGLVAIKPGRFNPLRSYTDPFRQVLVWRKVPRFVNTGLAIGFLNDGRMREIQETTRGAIFSHTQNFDERFDDLLRAPNPFFPNGPPDFEERPRNIAAFIETTTIDPPELKAYLNPNDPALNPACSSAAGSKCTPQDCLRTVGVPACDLYTVLVNDPLFTVPVRTQAQRRGGQIFRAQCMVCHSTPNVFSNIEHVPGNPLSFPPRIGHSYDIGVAQRNKHNLDFRAFECTTPPVPGIPCAQKQLITVTLPLARQDGQTMNFPVTVDPGAAVATGRYEDLYRFKVPQLRRISKLGPYFHDNSAATLDEVLDYFLSNDYRKSADGKNHPIRLNPQERQDLLEFLKIL